MVKDTSYPPLSVVVASFGSTITAALKNPSKGKINTKEKETSGCYLKIDELDGSRKVSFTRSNGTKILE